MKNNLAHADRISESTGFPAVVLIDNTNACNLRCSMCDHKNIRRHRPIQTMDWELYRKIIDEIAVEDPAVRVWQIFFGDPFLCRDMPQRVAYAKSQGLRDVVLNTNGMLMKPDRAQAMIAAGLDAIYVGVDAATPETYRQIRVGGDLAKVTANVLAYRDLLEAQGAPHQRLFVQYVVSDINAHEVEAFQDFWKAQRVNVKIRPKVSWGGLIDADNLHDNSDVHRKPCFWLMRTMSICADGRVALCAVDVHCRAVCGDIRQQSIKQVWGDILQEYRRMHQEGRFQQLPDFCRDCRDWQSAYSEYQLNARCA